MLAMPRDVAVWRAGPVVKPLLTSFAHPLLTTGGRVVPAIAIAAGIEADVGRLWTRIPPTHRLRRPLPPPPSSSTGIHAKGRTASVGRSYFHIHLVSDATGETLIAISRAAAAV